MMFTCSALRCSVFDGSAISGTSDDPGADDPLAAQCIPDSVLYVTVDDHAYVDVFRDLEHPTHLPFDASGDVRPDRKSTRLNSSHLVISYAVFCLKKKNTTCRS